jgi:hypothetical protein
LKRIDLTSSNVCCSTYLAYLIQAIKNSGRENTYNVNQLEDIFVTTISTLEELDHYFMACYLIRGNIKHLRFGFISHKFYINQQVGTFLDFLPHFESLTHLNIENESINLGFKDLLL